MHAIFKYKIFSRCDLRSGIADGLPIGLGYLTVSFAFGLFAAEGGMTPLTAVILSLTNLTSAGQFAGTQLIFAGAPYVEIGLTTLLINLRYMLMSLSLSQKIRPGIAPMPRLLIGYGITDEIYAVAVMHPGEPGIVYLAGLMTLPVVGWTSGTLFGAIAGSVLPLSLRSALGIALYAMFIAIIMPPARKSRPVLIVILLAAGLSVVGQLNPLLQSIPSGWRLIACTIIAALTGALIAPIHHTPLPNEKSPEDSHA
jgi:predicted branched-subunit amino acid permease